MFNRILLRLWLMLIVLCLLPSCAAPAPVQYESSIISTPVFSATNTVTRRATATPLPSFTATRRPTIPPRSTATVLPSATPTAKLPTVQPTAVPPTATTAFEPLTRWAHSPNGEGLVLWKTLNQADGAAGSVVSGAELLLLDYQNEHYLARVGDTEGWIHESYIINQAPAASAPPPPTAAPVVAPTEPPAPPPTVVLTEPPAPPVAPITEVTAWVDNEFPERGAVVTVYSKLIINGQPIAGATMATTWHYKSTDSYCDGVTGADGVASCARDSGRPTRGYQVDIEVVLMHEGVPYTAWTAFIPQ